MQNASVNLQYRILWTVYLTENLISKLPWQAA